MIHRSAVLSLSLLLATTGVMSLACDKSKDSSGAEAPATTPEDAEELAAMGHYAEAFNAMVAKPQECFKEYFKHIPKEGPEVGKRYRLFPRHTMAASGLSTAKTQIDEANEKASDKLEHLEPLAKAALSDLEQAVSLYADVHKYYDSESYKDDQGAKGQELHQKMVQLAESYRGHIDRLEAALSEVERQQAQRELELYEKDKGYSYWFRAFNFEANQLLRATEKDRYAKAFGELDKAYAGLKSFSDSKQGDLNTAFKAYLGQADRFHSTAVKTSRALGASEPDEEAVANLQGDLVDNYNNIVGVTNSLYQLEANQLLK